MIAILATLFLIVLIADFQAAWYKENKPISWWWHPVWVLPFLILPFAEYMRLHNVLIVLLLLFTRILFFSPTLNLIRHLPFFYLHGETTNGSWWDKQIEKLGIFYPISWSVLTLCYLVFIVFYLINY